MPQVDHCLLKHVMSAVPASCPATCFPPRLPVLALTSTNRRLRLWVELTLG